MKLFFFSFLAVFACFTCAAQNQNTENNVRAVIQEMETNWNKQVYTADQFDSDAVLINRVGLYLQGKAAIQDLWSNLGPVMFKHIRLKLSIDKIRFLSEKLAFVLVKSEDRVVSDFNLPDGRKGGARGDVSESVYSYVMIMQNDKWLITSLHITGIDKMAVAPGGAPRTP